MLIDIKVCPQSGKQRCILDKAGKLKCYLKSPPERGLANEELIRYIAGQLRIPKSQITIISGQSARLKRISIEYDITYGQLLEALGILPQMNIL